MNRDTVKSVTDRFLDGGCLASWHPIEEVVVALQANSQRVSQSGLGANILQCTEPLQNDKNTDFCQVNIKTCDLAFIRELMLTLYTNNNSKKNWSSRPLCC